MIDRKLPKPTWIRAYLKAHGWTEERQLPPAGAMYALTDIPGVSGPITVFVPSSEESPDYPLRVAEVVTTLAGVEDRPEGRVWADLRAPKYRSAAIGQMASPRQKRTPSRTKSRRSTKAPDLKTAPLAQHTLTIVSWEIRGFSRLTGQMRDNPTMVTDFLTAYYELARGVIQNHNGILDKFLGEEGMALFGHDLKGLGTDDGEESAVLAALEFSEKFDRLAAKWLPLFQKYSQQEVLMPRLACGIHTSEVLVGSGGTEQREFTGVGDVVDLAAQVLDQASGGMICVTNTVYARLTAIPGRAYWDVFNSTVEVELRGVDGQTTLHYVDRPMSG